MQFSRNSTHTTLAVTVLLMAFGVAWTSAMPLAQNDFDARNLLRPAHDPATSRSSLSLSEPGRFSMHQSYSLSAMSGPSGSMSSGLYLNTLSYQFTPLLTASVDVGFHTPLHSSVPGLEQSSAMGSLVVPRMGFEYRPSDRLTINLDVVNGPHAWKAYGGLPRSSQFLQGSRTP
jgi:hypothetical protein